jgi:hypothetical protein
MANFVLKSSVPEDGRNYCPKQVELIEIINKPLFLHLVGYIYYWQMGFNSVFKGLTSIQQQLENQTAYVVTNATVVSS